MSALGQEQTLPYVRRTSALPNESRHSLASIKCPLCANSGRGRYAAVPESKGCREKKSRQ